jgi:hypothetical protein
MQTNDLKAQLNIRHVVGQSAAYIKVVLSFDFIPLVLGLYCRYFPSKQYLVQCVATYNCGMIPKSWG